jgi:hypothetical protein
MAPRRKPSERALGSKSADERRGIMQAIGASLPRIAKPVLGKQGLGEAQLLQEWPAIIGDELARYCWPIKLSFPRGERRDGTLRLRVASALALEIQHREPVLLERINGYFGYRAVVRLALVQGPPPQGARATAAGAAPAGGGGTAGARTAPRRRRRSRPARRARAPRERHHRQAMMRPQGRLAKTNELA